MRLLKCKVENFASYAELSFDFSSQGLALIYGATGSGKSTLQDIPAWILYGITAKDGNVDEVRSWNAPQLPTAGSLEVESSTGTILVTRIRGKTSQNDLYWQDLNGPDEIGTTLHRGKDLTDTQRLLEERLGVSSTTYLTSAYFHEFSKTGTFFTAKAKDRRELFESIAPLARTGLLVDGLKHASSSDRRRLLDISRELDSSSSACAELQRSLADAITRRETWCSNQLQSIEALRTRSKNFEQEKAQKIKVLEQKYQDFERSQARDCDEALEKIESLGPVVHIPDAQADIARLKEQGRCPVCAGPKGGTSELIEGLQYQILTRRRYDALVESLERLNDSQNPHYQAIQDLKKQENHLDEQIAYAMNQVNPFTSQVKKFQAELADATARLKHLEVEQSKTVKKLTALTQLQDLTLALRGEILKATIARIQDQTNQALTSVFDSEFTVQFALTGSDNVDVTIQKNGNECVYRQLSKGQRQLLKLSFVTSVMSVCANHAGVTFGTVFLDEALDGLDTNLKVKAFTLLQQLETKHESVFVIDHDATFQALFDKRYHVQLEGDTSVVEEQHG